MVTIECDHQPAPVRGVHLGPLGWSIIKGNPTIVQVKRDTRCTWSLLVYMYVYMRICVCVYASRDHLPYCFLSWTSPRLFLRTRSMYNFRSVRYSARVSLLHYYTEMKIVIVNAWKIRKVTWQLVIIRLQVYVRWWLEKRIKVLSFVGHVSNLVENCWEVVAVNRPLEID